MTLTASKLELVHHCPGSITLPWTDERSEWSDGGNERHSEDEARIQAGDVPELYTERWPEVEAWTSEVSFAYDASDGTSRYLGTGIKRAYGELGPFEIAGTLDVLGRGPGVLVVVDKKSYEAVTPAAKNLQVGFGALSVSRWEPADHVYVAINHELTGLDVAELDAFDLDVVAHDIKNILVRSAGYRAVARNGESVPLNVGRWCRWCPAFHACPRQQELALQVKNPTDVILHTVLDEMTAPDVYALYRRVGILHKRLAQAINAYAAGRPIPLGGGKFYGPVTKRGNEKLDGSMVWSVVSELFDQETADLTVFKTATKTRLEDVLKGRKGALRQVLELVRERGGSKRSGGSTMEEYEARPQLVAPQEDE